MSMAPIDAVRLKSADKSIVTREVGRGDGTSVYFKLGHRSILTTPAPQIRIDGILQVAGYTINYADGVVTFGSAPTLGAEIEFNYYWSQFTDSEVQYFLDESGGNVAVATARLLLAIAADASKVAERQSLAGGGGIGAITIDTSVAARELRNTAQAIVQMEAQIGDVQAAEALTEIAWTEFGFRAMVGQHIVRES